MASTSVPAASSPELRAALTAEEQRRRDAVLKVLSERTSYTKDNVSYLFKRCEEKMLDQLVTSKELPTLSASYFAWCVECNVWDLVFGKEGKEIPAFPYQRPEKYGQPYSQTYLAGLQKRMARDAAAGTLDELDAAVFGAARGQTDDVPLGCERHPEALARLWEELWPGRPYEVGCDGPFEILFPVDDFVYFHQCVPSNLDEVKGALRYAAYQLGGQEVVLIAAMGAAKSVKLCLDFDEGARFAEPSFARRFRQAWEDLLRVNLEWLAGRTVNINTFLAELNENLAKKPGSRLFDRVEKAHASRRRLEDRLAEAAELRPDDPDGALRLLAFQHQVVRMEALEEAASIPQRPADDPAAWTAYFELVDGFARDPRFCCLSRHDIAKMIEPKAALLGLARVEYILQNAADKDEARRGLNEFVADKAWARVLTPSKRVEFCVAELEKHPETADDAEAWGAYFREFIAAGGLDAED
ncbi:hypothetical protein DL768_011744 [Monosporascus sp. mg162]|nr:hypothetical protein DL768_011744 [Monosporascus sp. mg162]